jgi:endonuclease G, mitochondrial
MVVSAIGDPEIGDKVIKSGRNTGVTRGIVVRIEVNTKLQYGGGVSGLIGGFEIGPDNESPAPQTIADGRALKILSGPSEYFE